MVTFDLLYVPLTKLNITINAYQYHVSFPNYASTSPVGERVLKFNVVLKYGFFVKMMTSYIHITSQDQK